MTFEEYQKLASSMAFYQEKIKPENRIFYAALGLAGESGEVADKIKKVLRDKNGIFDEETKDQIMKELGDVLWYISQFGIELGMTLDKIAEKNLEKLKSRRERGTLSGNGDNR